MNTILKDMFYYYGDNNDLIEKSIHKSTSPDKK